MVSANASVTDVNRQSFASNLELLVHPSTLYVGIRSTRQFVREGEPIDVEAIVTDIDGKPVAGRSFTITAAGRVEVRERDVGRHRRGSQALRGDVVEQAGVVLDQGGRRRSVQDHGGGHRRRRRPQPQRVHALGERCRNRADARRRAGKRDRGARQGHLPSRRHRSVARRRPVRQRQRAPHGFGQRHHADPALRARSRLGGRQRADRRHRHADSRCRSISPGRRRGCGTTGRRIPRFRRVRPSRGQRFRCRCSRRTRH